MIVDCYLTKGDEMAIRKFQGITCAMLILLSLILIAGCGGGETYTQKDIEGKRYLYSDETFDSRTLEFKADGTFQLDVITAASTNSLYGKYTVEGDTVTLNFEATQLEPEYSEKTTELKITTDGTHLADGSGHDWFQL